MKLKALLATVRLSFRAYAFQHNFSTIQYIENPKNANKNPLRGILCGRNYLLLGVFDMNGKRQVKRKMNFLFEKSNESMKHKRENKRKIKGKVF